MVPDFRKNDNYETVVLSCKIKFVIFISYVW